MRTTVLHEDRVVKGATGVKPTHICTVIMIALIGCAGVVLMIETVDCLSMVKANIIICRHIEPPFPISAQLPHWVTKPGASVHWPGDVYKTVTGIHTGQ